MGAGVAVYAADCTCGTARVVQFTHDAATDADAARVFAARKALYENRDELGRPRYDGPRYWIVHGPGGHVIGVRR